MGANRVFRKLSLALAVATAVSSVGAYALGIGDLEARSGLNQQFHGEIGLRALGTTAVEDIQVRLASPEAFERAGVERVHTLTRLRFKAQMSAEGRPVIKVTSNEPIQEPFLNFILAVEWPKGRILREYTVLLDPPGMKPAPYVAKAEMPVPAKRVATPARPVSSYQRNTTPAPAISDGVRRHGPVAANETLWSIAQSMGIAGAATEQVLMALLRQNPQAFIDGNPNHLIKGATLVLAEPSDVFSMSPGQAATAYREVSRPLTQTARSNVVGESMASPMVAEENAVAAVAPIELTRLEQEARRLREENERLKRQLQELRVQVADQARVATGEVAMAGEPPPMEPEQPVAALDLADEPQSLPQVEVVAPINEVAIAELEVPPMVEAETMPPVDEPVTMAEPAIDQAAPEQPALDQPLAIELLVEAEPLPTDTVDSVPMEGLDTLTTGEAVDMALDAALGEGLTTPALSAGQPLVLTTDGLSTAGLDGAAEDGETPVAEPEPPTAVVETVAIEPETPAPDAQPQAVEAPAVETAVTEPAAASQTEEVAPVAVEPDLPPPQKIGLMDQVSSVLGDNAPLVGGGLAALLALLAGGWYFARGRNKSDRETDADESLLIDTHGDGDETNLDAGESETPSFLSDFSTSDISALREDSTEVDPIAETDVYIAYGRMQAAEDLVKEAIDKEPDRIDLRQKLAEVYFAAKKSDEFVALVSQLQESGVEQQHADVWSKLLSMGRDLAPDHDLFQGVAVEDESDGSIDGISDLGSLEEMNLSEMMQMEDGEPDFGLGETQRPAHEKPSAQAAVSEDDASSIPSLDLSDLEALEEIESGKDNRPDTSAGLDGFGFGEGLGQGDDDLSIDQMPDLELSLDDLESLENDLSIEGDAGVAIDDLGDEESLSDLAREAESVGDDDSAPVVPPKDDYVAPKPEFDENDLAAALEENLGEVEDATIELDLGDEPTAVKKPAAGDDEDFGDLDLDLDGLDLSELDVTQGDADSQLAPEVSLADMDSEFFDSGFVTDDDNLGGDVGGADEGLDEIATKLDLARAYIEMEDKDGARSILEEVVSQGNEEQQKEAKDLLAKLV